MSVLIVVGSVQLLQFIASFCKIMELVNKDTHSINQNKVMSCNRIWTCDLLNSLILSRFTGCRSTVIKESNAIKWFSVASSFWDSKSG